MTEEKEKKKEYLKGYERAIRQMERSKMRIREIRLNKMCPGIIADDMPHASGQRDLSDYAVSLDEEEQRYIKTRYQRIKLCREICDRIEQLDDEDEKDVLMYRYIKLLKWEDICVMMEHSWQHVHRIHSKALENFKM